MTDSEQLAFEREKFAAEMELRREELEFARQRELSGKKELKPAWRGPVFLAISGAVVAALGNAFVAYLNNSYERQLQREEAEAARVLEAIRTGNPDTAAENLEFMLDASLISESAALRSYLRQREPGQGVSLPSGVDTFVSELRSLILSVSQLGELNALIRAMDVPGADDAVGSIEFVLNRIRELNEMDEFEYTTVQLSPGSCVVEALSSDRRALWTIDLSESQLYTNCRAITAFIASVARQHLEPDFGSASTGPLRPRIPDPFR